MSNDPVPNYLAYLVRLWRSEETGVWHATLQDPHSGQQFRFESVASLFDFLRNQLGESPIIAPPPLDQSSPQDLVA